MEDLSLHVMDLIDNCIAAQASEVELEVCEDEREDELSITLRDNGRGMDDQTLERADDPFFTTKAGRTTGLGIALFAQAAREAGGSLQIASRAGEGTEIRARFRRSHPDLKPLGDFQRTMRALRVAHPEITFSYRHRIRKVGGTIETQA